VWNEAEAEADVAAEFVAVPNHRPYECIDFQCRVKVNPRSHPIISHITDEHHSVKTIIILSYGWISEGRPLTVKDSLGIILALGGATVYSQLSRR
jgi:hypothetical protein